MEEKKRSEWRLEKAFEQDGLLVEVSGLLLGRKKVFSLCVGSKGEDGMRRFISVRQDTRDNTKCDLLMDYARILGKLLQQAQDYVQMALMGQFENQVLYMESRDAGRSPGKRQSGPHRVGKTARDRAKKTGGKRTEET